MFRDGTYGSRDGAGAPNQSARPYDRFNTYKGSTQNGDRFGLDNNQYEPFFTSIQISQLARHQYLTLTLVNPIIEKYMTDNSIYMLLDKKNVFIASKDYDVTKNLIELIDNQIKTLEIK